jgi:hypothetical protein
MSQEFTHFAGQVRAMLGEGATLEAIGAAVDTLPLPTEERSALWLLAWSSRPARSANRDGWATPSHPSRRSTHRRPVHVASQ